MRGRWWALGIVLCLLSLSVACQKAHSSPLHKYTEGVNQEQNPPPAVCLTPPETEVDEEPELPVVSQPVGSSWLRPLVKADEKAFPIVQNMPDGGAVPAMKREEHPAIAVKKKSLPVRIPQRM